MMLVSFTSKLTAEAAVLAVIGGALIWGARHYKAEGVAQCVAEFKEADEKGAENVRNTADKIMRDIGRGSDPVELLGETNGLRD